MSALHGAFARARAERRAALVGYLPSGFPTQAEGIALACAMVGAGVDVVEVGLPYSDPLMDGPVIQAAVHRALTGGSSVAHVLGTVEAVAATGAPTLVMSYWNPIERVGVEAFARRLAAAGGVGVITPDLPPDEAGDWITASDAAHLDRVFLVAPSSTQERIAAVAAATTGFVYAASTMGVTGARASVGGGARDLVARVRAVTDLPVAVGLGVSTGEQAAEVAGYADGVIVGSAFIQRILDAPDHGAAVAAVADLAAELAEGVRRPVAAAPQTYL
ncbi:MAG: tryptophan synthase subunit alpha [Candidatus Nanopelagicales bacterium]|nr:tryptophan synthase subunit alpha [Candidatus Nanopelagicales bacterium]